MNRVLCLLFLLTMLCSVASTQPVDATVCDVLANPPAFDGKTIRLKAVAASARFDEFVIEDPSCSAAGAIWLAYPEGTKGKAGPAAFMRLQLAKNAAAAGDDSKRAAVTLVRNGDFAKFDSLLATPYKSPAMCLGCPRYFVTATVAGRLDGVKTAGLIRDGGKVTGVAGFGNLNSYPARLVLESVSDVAAHDVDYSKTVNGDSRRVERAPADQVSRAAAAFGAEGEQNGVGVGMGVANEVAPHEFAKGDSDSPDGLLFLLTFDMNRLGKSGLSAAISHMGTHIADIRGGVAPSEDRAWRTTFH